MNSTHYIPWTVYRMFLLFKRKIEDKEELQLWHQLIGYFQPSDRQLLSNYRSLPYQPALQEKVITILTKGIRTDKDLKTHFEKYNAAIVAIVSRRRLGEQQQPGPKYTQGAFLGEADPFPQPIRPDIVTCYLQGEMESPIIENKVIAIAVTISRERLMPFQETVADEVSAEVLANQPLILQCRPVENFRLVGPDTIRLTVPEKAKPETVAFNGKCTREDRCSLAIDVWQGQLLLCTMTLQPTCTRASMTTEMISARVSGTLLKPLKSPIHQLRITKRKEGDWLYYTYYLDSPVLGIFNKYETDRIDAQDAAVLMSLCDKIDRLWTTAAGSADEVENLLRDYGNALFSRLIPLPLQRVLWISRDKIQSFMVVSEGSVIPWELVLLRDPDRNNWLPADRFFSEMGLIRWLYGWQPVDDLILRPGKARMVIPEYLDYRHYLPASVAEKEYLQKNLGAIPIDPIARNVREFLMQRNDFDLLHFTCHGTVNEDRGGDLRLILQDRLVANVPLPTYLELLSLKQMPPFCMPGDPRPAVVLNACHSGTSPNQAIGAGSFASAFLGAGAGIFVGTLWSIEDNVAFHFISCWYDALQQGNSLSQATVLAREAAKSKKGATYLSYVVYGHPDACLKMALAPSPGT